MSNSPPNDIPPARREPTEISLAEIEMIGVRVKPKRRGLTLSLLMLAGMAGVMTWQWNKLSPHVTPRFNTVKAAFLQIKEGGATGETSAPLNAAVAPPEAATGETPDDEHPDELLSHRRYDEASQDVLVALNPNSKLRLQPAAHAELTAMIAKAKSEGVRLGIISAFRTLEDQNYLYFDVKAERGESAKTRAEVSAPPGYSEHHTGYAVDFIDEGEPATHVEKSFETTAAYKWLEKNAAFYNFEMSFPEDPSSSVDYEPWHWRYVGNQESLELFYK